MDRNWGDDRLLATVLEWQERNPGKCIVVTLDYHLTSRADAHGLAWHRLDEKYQTAVRADPLMGEIKRELDQLKQAQPFASVHITSEDAKTFIRLERPRIVRLSEAEIEAEMAQVRSNHPKVGTTSTSLIASAYFRLSEVDQRRKFGH